MKMLYKYPQNEFPYQLLVEENKRRSNLQSEFELIDTGIFNDNKYFDVFIEYAKEGANDILIKITLHNRGDEDASLHVLPTLWFRNTWSWGYDDYKPKMYAANDGNIRIDHRTLGNYTFHLDSGTQLLFCENESNFERLYNIENVSAYTKDGINEYLVNNDHNAISAEFSGTKAAANYDISIKAHSSATLRFRLEKNSTRGSFEEFDEIFEKRINEDDGEPHHLHLPQDPRRCRAERQYRHHGQYFVGRAQQRERAADSDQAGGSEERRAILQRGRDLRVHHAHLTRQ
jgi:hypothetical protein